jgi:hypothetical protein
MKTLKRITLLMTLVSFIAFQGFSQVASTAKAKDNPQTTKDAKSGTTPSADVKTTGCCMNGGKMNSGQCAKFVDKNGDGICDNKGTCCQNKGNANCCQGKAPGCQGKATGCQHMMQGCGNKTATTPDPQKTPEPKK